MNLKPYNGSDNESESQPNNGSDLDIFTLADYLANNKGELTALCRKICIIFCREGG